MHRDRPPPLVLSYLAEGAAALVWLIDTLPVGKPERVELAPLLRPGWRRGAHELRRQLSGATTTSQRREIARRIRTFGSALSADLLPETIRDHLKRSLQRPLYLQVDEATMAVPWELAFDGESFLGEKFSVARCLGSGGAVVPAASTRPPQDAVGVLLIRGQPVSPLCLAYCEVLSDLSIAERLQLTIIDAGMLPRADALAACAEHDVIHYAGVVDQEGNAGAAATWWWGDEPLDVRELAALPTPPRLLISESPLASVAPRVDRGHDLSLARSAAAAGMNLLLRGTGATKEANLEFTRRFYRELARGAAAGDALRTARASSGPDDDRERVFVEATLYGDGQQVVFAPARRPRQLDNRRQVTVMCCDVVESTRLLRSLGAEGYSEVLVHYRRLFVDVASKHGGCVEEVKGDGILCFFGFPIAQEYCAVQALKAAHAFVAAVAELGVEVRIGIDTGQVVVRDGNPFGDPIHFAARLQAAAAPGTVYVSNSTREVLRDKFAFRLVDERPQLKGYDDGAAVYVALGELPAGAAGLQDAALPPTPFIGRADELRAIEAHWQAVLEGERRTVLLTGEAGIGKSRLVQEFVRSLEARGYRTLQARCTPHDIHSPFRPMIDLVRRQLRMRDDDSDESKLEKIEAGLKATGGEPGSAPLFATLLSIPNEARYPDARMPDRKRRDLTLKALTDWIINETLRSPTCVVVEDLQWIDPSTAEYLDRLVIEAARRPLLIVTTRRSDGARGADPDKRVPEIELRPLAMDAARAMVIGASGPSRLSSEVVRLLAAKTDGIPLFIEESTRMAVDVGLGTHSGADAATLEVAVPARIHDLLMARLDRLRKAKVVAQIGAAIGRQFTLALLEAVVLHDKSLLGAEVLSRHLEALVKSGLLVATGESPHTSYYFRHALIRDAAYQSLLERRRAALHRAIATVIGNKFGSLKDSQPELLAYHYAEAGMVDESIAFWEIAARQAASRSALYESIGHLKKGLELVEGQPPSPVRDRTELKLQLLLAGRLIATEGYGAEPVERAYARASQLCGPGVDPGAWLKVQLGLEGYHFMRANFETAREIADRVAAAASLTEDLTRRLQSRWAVANILFHRGELPAAVKRMDECLAEYDDRHHHRHAVQDVGVMCLCYSAWGKWELGYPDQALARARRVVDLATRLDHRFSMGEAHGFLAVIHHFRGENERAREHAERAITICDDHGFAVWLAHAKLMRGRVIAELGDPEAGIQAMGEAYQLWDATGAVVTTPFYLAMQAEGFALARRPDHGLALLDRALEIVDRCGERYYEAEIKRLYGSLLLQSGAIHGLDRSGEAERWFLSGLEQSEQAKVHGLKLRGALGLAQLWSSQGRVAEVDLVLRPTYEWFSEGAETADLVRARTLLAAAAAAATAG